ncbi:uncharacterized protein LOC107608822 isoform X2 [Arachis ipaensis]|uniref:uncharacterized protein LOC107608822 isoform X2 n=1 Tax=Arachis ipaensis TaxID=130454 RepID=UPI000A2B585A|nr:uncharacterized protein LOC107608822 isoform X2 [Arachis ipaensis]
MVSFGVKKENRFLSAQLHGAPAPSPHTDSHVPPEVQSFLVLPSNKPQPSNLHHCRRDWDWDTGTTTTTSVHSHGLTSHSFFLELSVCHCLVCSAAVSPPSVALRSFLSSSGRRAPSLQPLSSFTNRSFCIWSSSAQPRFCRRPCACRLVAFVRCAQPLSLALCPDCSDRRRGNHDIYQ